MGTTDQEFAKIEQTHARNLANSINKLIPSLCPELTIIVPDDQCQVKIENDTDPQSTSSTVAFSVCSIGDLSIPLIATLYDLKREALKKFFAELHEVAKENPDDFENIVFRDDDCKLTGSLHDIGLLIHRTTVAINRKFLTAPHQGLGSS